MARDRQRRPTTPTSVRHGSGGRRPADGQPPPPGKSVALPLGSFADTATPAPVMPSLIHPANPASQIRNVSSASCKLQSPQSVAAINTCPINMDNTTEEIANPFPALYVAPTSSPNQNPPVLTAGLKTQIPPHTSHLSQSPPPSSQASGAHTRHRLKLSLQMKRTLSRKASHVIKRHSLLRMFLQILAQGSSRINRYHHLLKLLVFQTPGAVPIIKHAPSDLSKCASPALTSVVFVLSNLAP